MASRLRTRPRRGAVVLVRHADRQILRDSVVEHRGEENHQQHREHNHAETVDAVLAQDVELAQRNVEDLSEIFH